MKKARIFLAAAMSIMLSACSQTKDLENTPAPVIGEFSETENDDKTLTEDHDEDGGSITDESKTDLYEDETTIMMPMSRHWKLSGPRKFMKGNIRVIL